MLFVYEVIRPLKLLDCLVRQGGVRAKCGWCTASGYLDRMLGGCYPTWDLPQTWVPLHSPGT